MATEEELLEQKKILEERKLGLEKYQVEFMRIRGGIAQAKYRINSGFGSAVDIETNRSLQKELKAKIAGLKKDYQVTPRFIPRLISECDYEIFRIRRQLDKIGTQDLSRALPPEPGGEGSHQGLMEDPCRFSQRRSGIAQQLLARPQERSRGWSRDR